MLIAGVDEAGRGPLAGPVTVSAVILAGAIDGLDDSKKLSEKKRRLLVNNIKAQALAWSVVHISVDKIDQINIFQATMLGMKNAVSALHIEPHKILVDGNKTPDFKIQAEAIVGGDGKIAAISAASILAKTARDDLMIQLDKEFPDYGFAQHKGYGTQQHLAALNSLGPCVHHRKTFAPVKNLLQMELYS
ncbi:ribonuclease HII [Marinicella litoralis]|uniref:Ribonuclease HII n=1 Tax=Marinicella litoralis TaxID=644220 RepID=A0A4R6XSZ0_9GAMM|nr:ribonuclease HII [Marinicella litoralis]TDR19468.1 RNase HII [Marinicella litoralis]